MTAALSPDGAALARRLDRPVVLVGMMGVGKSSVGRRLAAALGVEFVDADEAIEQAARMTIPEIFAQYGEATFRNGERRVIARLLGAEGAETPQVSVIATGGGAFVNDDTRALILARGHAVWLDADIDTLVERTGRKNNRPLLQQGDPREILTRLREERQACYAQAPIHVTSSPGPQQRTLAEVMAALNDHLGKAAG
jgi:shikimate kinase